MRPNHFRFIWLLAALLILSIMGAEIWQNTTHANEVQEFSENDVHIKVEIKRDDSGQWSLFGTFTPILEHFHLYSKDLPKDGLNGLGRPTLLEVASPSDMIRLTGPLTANQTPHQLYFESLALSFPVYPEGPVTLSLPFEFTGKNVTDSIELSVTYMACSDQTCLAPVIDRHFIVQIPHNP